MRMSARSLDHIPEILLHRPIVGKRVLTISSGPPFVILIAQTLVVDRLRLAKFHWTGPFFPDANRELDLPY